MANTQQQNPREQQPQSHEDQQHHETSERIQPGSDDRGQPSRQPDDPMKNYKEQADRGQSGHK